MVRRFLAIVVIITGAAPLAAGLASGEIVRHQLIMPGGQTANGDFQVFGLTGQAAVGTTVGVGITHNAGYVHLMRDYYIGARVAVAFSAFDAVVVDRQVELTWAVGEADGLIGFSVYRRDSDAMAFHPLTDELLTVEDGFIYRDDSVLPGQRYTYRLGAVDADGEFVSVGVSVDIPAWKTELGQNFPNPFNPTTSIEYYLAASEHVTLKVYDVAGRLVRTLADDPQSYGRHDVMWDGRTNNGGSASSGIYFYRLIAGQYVFTKKMTLLK